MKPMRVLLVDDNEDFLNSVTSFLQDRPQIEIAGKVLSGQEAVDQTRTLKPDLVLMDLMMPKMDGLEATRLLKQLANAPTVIVVSLHDDPSFISAVQEAGADAFLRKRALSKLLLPLLEKLMPCTTEGPAMTNDLLEQK